MIYTKKGSRDVSPTASSLSSNDGLGIRAIDTLAQTRSSNTGLNSQDVFEVGIDWLDVTFRNVPSHGDLREILSDFEALADEVIDFSPSRSVFNGRMWDGSGRGVRGTLVYLDNGLDNDGAIARPMALKIVASGKVLAAVDEQALAYWLSSRAISNALDSTRIDIALDDRDRSVELWKITEAYKAGNFFNTKWRGFQEGGERGEDTGISIYFGAPSSDRRLRIYDKFYQSLKKRLGIRWEAQFRKRTACCTLYAWIKVALEGPKEAAKWAVNTVLGVVDFRDRSAGDPNRDRCPVLDWFADLVERLQAAPARIRVPVFVPTVQKSIDWIIKSVAPSLATIKKVIGTDFPSFIAQTITDGEERLSIAKRKLIERTEKQQLIY